MLKRCCFCTYFIHVFHCFYKETYRSTSFLFPGLEIGSKTSIFPRPGCWILFCWGQWWNLWITGVLSSRSSHIKREIIRIINVVGVWWGALRLLCAATKNRDVIVIERAIIMIDRWGFVLIMLCVRRGVSLVKLELWSLNLLSNKGVRLWY